MSTRNTKMFIQTSGKIPAGLSNKLSAALEPLWDLYTKAYRPDIDLLVKVSHSPAFEQNEADEGQPPKMVSYPETLEVKFEADSNHFYSVRVSDFRFIREGALLDGAGKSDGEVCSIIRKDLIVHRSMRIHGDLRLVGTHETKAVQGE